MCEVTSLGDPAAEIEYRNMRHSEKCPRRHTDFGRANGIPKHYPSEQFNQ